jgi:hypothetical protein
MNTAIFPCVDIDRDHLRQQVAEHTGGGEVWETVAAYQVYRQREDGNMQEVAVVIRYNESVGYMLTATDSERKLTATGNSERELDVMMATVHWYQLDR